MEAADPRTDSPVIVTQSVCGARKYAGAPFLRHLILAAIEEFRGHIPGVYAPRITAPARTFCQRSIQLGFSSVMMDGSLQGRRQTRPTTTTTSPSTRRLCLSPTPAACPWKVKLRCLGRPGDRHGWRRRWRGPPKGVLEPHSPDADGPRRSCRLRQGRRMSCLGLSPIGNSHALISSPSHHAAISWRSSHQGDPCA